MLTEGVSIVKSVPQPWVSQGLASWVPRHLREEHALPYHHPFHHFQHYHNEGENLLNHIIMKDETWIHHYEPESKQQIMKWKHKTSLVSKKFRSWPSAGKLMLCVFWDSRGPVCEYYL
jgi:hypothetical protein